MEDYTPKIDSETSVDKGQVVSIEDVKEAMNIYMPKEACSILHLEQRLNNLATKEDLERQLEALTGGPGLTLTVNTEPGSSVTAVKISDDSIKATAISANNQAVIDLPESGTYNVYSEINGIRSNTVQVECSGNYPASLKYIILTIEDYHGSVESVVTVSKDSYSYTKTINGSVTFYLPETGVWNVYAESESIDMSVSNTVNVTEYKEYNLQLQYPIG